MDSITALLQILVAFGLLNVWLIRRDQKTSYRGYNSNSLKNEFKAYGLPSWSFYVVGFFKISAALLLLLGLWIPVLVFPSAFVVSMLMVGAVSMHIKVKDPLKKMLPASIMLFCSIVICIGSLNHFRYN